MSTEAQSDRDVRLVDRAHRIAICPAAPSMSGQVWAAADGDCPYCHKPIAAHEEFLSLDLKAPETPEQPLEPSNPELEEALDLLALWYGRWQGRVSGTPAAMQSRTRLLLEASGRSPQKGARQ